MIYLKSYDGFEIFMSGRHSIRISMDFGKSQTFDIGRDCNLEDLEKTKILSGLVSRQFLPKV